MNKFYLVPEDIYKGLTKTNTGNINLDFTKESLDSVKNNKDYPEIKNANYNQILRRYLHLRKEHENKPVKVQIDNFPDMTKPEESQPQQPQQASEEDETLNETRLNESQTPIGYRETFQQIVKGIVSDREFFQLTDDNKIKNEHGKIIEGSNVFRSIKWIIGKRRGVQNLGPRPRGTFIIEDKIDKNETINNLIDSVTAEPDTSFTTPKQVFSPKSKFSPKLWPTN